MLEPKFHQKPGKYFWGSESRQHTWKSTFVKPRTPSQSESSQYLAFICHIVIILLIRIKPLSQALHPKCEYNNYPGAKKGGGFQSCALSWEQTFWLWQQERNTILTYVRTETWMYQRNLINYRFVKVFQSSGSDLQVELKKQRCFSYLEFQSLQVPHYRGVCLLSS